MWNDEIGSISLSERPSVHCAVPPHPCPLPRREGGGVKMHPDRPPPQNPCWPAGGGSFTLSANDARFAQAGGDHHPRERSRWAGGRGFVAPLGAKIVQRRRAAGGLQLSLLAATGPARTIRLDYRPAL